MPALGAPAARRRALLRRAAHASLLPADRVRAAAALAPAPAQVTPAAPLASAPPLATMGCPSAFGVRWRYIVLKIDTRTRFLLNTVHYGNNIAGRERTARGRVTYRPGADIADYDKLKMLFKIINKIYIVRPKYNTNFIVKNQLPVNPNFLL